MAVDEVRSIALNVLTEILEKGSYTQDALHAALEVHQYLPHQERAFLSQLVCGTVERAWELDYFLNRYSKVPVKKMKPVICTVLRMALYEIMFLKAVPESASVNEAVKLVRKRGFANLTGFVNGVLRTIVRDVLKGALVYPDPVKTPAANLSVRYSEPEWLAESWLSRFGAEQTERMLAASIGRAPLTIRTNLLKNSPEELAGILAAEGVTAVKSSCLDYAFTLEGYDYLEKLDSFREGRYLVQDVSSMLVGECLKPQIGPDCRILDLCAAPGGKALHAAELAAAAGGSVTACDVSPKRAERIRENQERMGIRNLKIVTADARTWTDPEGSFDVVTADVPCSGLGVIRRKADIKYRITPDSFGELVKLQREILTHAVSLLKPGGTLVFSTCTVNSSENEENRAFLLAGGGLEPVNLTDCIPEPLLNRSGAREQAADGMLQLLPDEELTDGFYLAKFRKAADRQ